MSSVQVCKVFACKKFTKLQKTEVFIACCGKILKAFFELDIRKPPALKLRQGVAKL